MRLLADRYLVAGWIRQEITDWPFSAVYKLRHHLGLSLVGFDNAWFILAFLGRSVSSATRLSLIEETWDIFQEFRMASMGACVAPFDVRR